MRYATKRSSSNQGRGVRRVRVVRGAHDDGHYKHGPIIVVEDLSDPYNPGQTKTLYVHRISEIRDSEESVYVPRMVFAFFVCFLGGRGQNARAQCGAKPQVRFHATDRGSRKYLGG